MEKSRKPPDYVKYVLAQAGIQPRIIRMFRSHPMEPTNFKINHKIPTHIILLIIITQLLLTTHAQTDIAERFLMLNTTHVEEELGQSPADVVPLVRQVKANFLRCLELEEEPPMASRQADVKIPPELIANYLNQREQMRFIVPNDEDFYGRLPRAHPLVKRHADAGPNTRQRNPTNRKQQRQRYTRIPDKCAKRNMNIKFDHVGWSDWIIAPAAFNAYYCAGECSYPMSDYQNATNHGIIQSIFHSVGRVVPRSCCAPIKMGRIAILYQLDGNVHMRQYDDMVVEACGCL